MLKTIAAALVALSGSFASANAATVDYKITSVSSALEICAPVDPQNNQTCNFGLVDLPAGSPGFSGSTTFPAISAGINIMNLVTVGQDVGGEDAFSFRVTVGVLINNTSTFFYRMTASVTGWKPTGNGNGDGNVAKSTAISWINPDFDAGSPIQVGFTTLSPFQGTSIPVYFTVAALAPSVVPLPAGVLLLGTALLGLFGLSRRRKLAAA